MARRRKAPIPHARGPFFKKLSPKRINEVLARNSIGRIAFVSEHHIELQPVHYIFDNGHIYGRTSFGAKYVAWLHRPFVAFEVDENEGPYDWRSVIARGTVYVLLPRGTPAEKADYARATRLIKMRQPLAFTPRDPTPYRSVVFRIEVNEMTGREARTG